VKLPVVPGWVVARLSVGFGLAGVVGVAGGVAGPVGVQEAASLEDLQSGTTALLQAVSAVDGNVIWVSGHEGVVLRSLDGGDTWRRRPVQSLDSLEFRDIHGFDADRAVILSSGPGAQSRLYRTDDGGQSWSLRWVNGESDGFYDCLDFWDDRRGLAYGDAVGGELRVLLTSDGGATWHMVPGDRLPPALDGEGGFAASGTCVRAGPGGRAWIGTGAGVRSRVLRTPDFGRSWDAVDLPIVTGEAAGAFTLAFSDADRGIVLGGDLERPDGWADDVAMTADGGSTWALAARMPFAGAVYGSAVVRSGLGWIVAAAPGGLAASEDMSGPWRLLDGRSFWAVGSAEGVAWAVGPEGRVVRFTLPTSR